MCVPTAGLASRHAANPYPFHVAADAWHGHPQPWAGCSARLPHGGPCVWQPAGVWLEVSLLELDSVSTLALKSLKASSLVTGSLSLTEDLRLLFFFQRGRHGNQYDGIGQQDSSGGRHAASQSHNSGAAHSRAQQGKRSKGRQAESRARYPVRHPPEPVIHLLLDKQTLHWVTRLQIVFNYNALVYQPVFVWLSAVGKWANWKQWLMFICLIVTDEAMAHDTRVICLQLLYNISIPHTQGEGAASWKGFPVAI